MSRSVKSSSNLALINQSRRQWVASGLATGLASSLAISLPGLAAAQGAFPNRPMKMIVPWTPGQATDLVGRIAAQEISKALGQAVVVENKAGAGGLIGTDAVAKAAADGYTLLAASSGPVSIAPLLQKVPFDPDKELTAVALMGIAPFVLVTAPDFPAKDIREFVAKVKAAPGKFTFASSGTGATAHLFAEAFNAATGIQALHVPYKGSVPALADVMSGQVNYCVETAASTMPLIRAGKLKAYGLSIGRETPLVPGVPPFASALGLTGFDMGAWIGVMLPGGTPKAIVDQMAGIIEKSMQNPEVKKTFATISVEPEFKGPSDLTAYMKAYSSRMADVIKRNQIKVS
ncbi:MAG: tripartite tricarboxylate transporter substrate binding protein [Betaproteobacteria bacterium]|nr:tripartite tricarboxylate transporter substrate binding protein [Betaproteobacteria bacterium]